MKKGISDANFIKELGIRGFLSEVQKAGFDGVELNYWEQGGALNPNTSTTDINEILSLAQHYHVEIATLSTGLLNNFPLSSGNRDVREKGIKIASHMIDLAEEMGVGIIQLVPGVATEETLYSDSYRYATESLRYLGDKAEEAEVMIGIENVTNKFLPSAGEYSTFLQELNHPAVKAYFDNGNALVTGFINDFTHLLDNQIIAIHLKDYRSLSGDFVSILDGDTNWPEMMRALQKIPYKGYLICTPHYPYDYCHKRIIHQYYGDLIAVMNLMEGMEGVDT